MAHLPALDTLQSSQTGMHWSLKGVANKAETNKAGRRPAVCPALSMVDHQLDERLFNFHSSPRS